MPDPMSREPEVVALENALPIALAEADDAGSEADDWTGSEYVMRMALSAVAALHAAGYRVVAADAETLLLAAARKAISDRYDDLRWCGKDDDCHEHAEGVALALADFDAALATHRGGTPA